MLRETLEGYARANAFFRQERREALTHITPEQAWATFRALWRVWEKAGQDQGNLEPLYMLKVERLIRQRRTLDRLASGQA
jgi:hypothetical protein